MKETVLNNFAAGTGFSFVKSYPDYPATAGWTLTYYFRGAGSGFNRAASAVGESFVVTIQSSDTSDSAPGKYRYQAFLEKTGENQILVDEGDVRIMPNLSRVEIGETFDGRTPSEVTLDNIRAMLGKKATVDQQEYSIGTRQLRRIPIPELIQLEQLYAQRVGRERTAERLRKGGKFFKTVLVRQRD